MSITSRYVFLASMDVDPDREALFNEVYDTEHVPNLLQVPGVLAVSRMTGEDFALSIGGQVQQITHQPARYLAIYEIESPAVLASDCTRAHMLLGWRAETTLEAGLVATLQQPRARGA